MACRAAIGRHMLVLKNAKSVAAREITEKEQGADHCSCDNQKLAMDTILLWLESLSSETKPWRNYKNSPVCT
jgi:hypothetical protein